MFKAHNQEKLCSENVHQNISIQFIILVCLFYIYGSQVKNEFEIYINGQKKNKEYNINDCEIY